MLHLLVRSRLAIAEQESMSILCPSMTMCTVSSGSSPMVRSMALWTPTPSYAYFSALRYRSTSDQ